MNENDANRQYPRGVQFVPFYHSRGRIKVRLACGEIYTGWVSMSGGTTPVFLLMQRRDSRGSWITLDERDEILAVQVWGRYVPYDLTQPLKV